MRPCLSVTGFDMPDRGNIAGLCDLAGSLIRPPLCHDDEKTMIVLRRPGPMQISEADAYIFRLVRQVCAGRKTAPWAFHVVGPGGTRMGRVRYSVAVSYQPISLAQLARFIAAEPDFDTRWRLVVEFLKEYHQEPAGARQRLLADAPGPTGDERWDVLFAGLAEHLAMRDGTDAPGWSASRGLRRFWFPFNTPGARAQALVHAPAAFRRRGVFVADYEIDAA